MDIKLRDLIRVVNAAAQVEEMNFAKHVDVTKPGFGESFRDWIASASTEDLAILALSLQKLVDAAHGLVRSDVRLSASECLEATEE